ncbi:hypothetical protein FACS1894176_06620 [Bacteroidia bacterium]|nr:hypothetical protein FACS189428_2210 [Clostridia bacterium]GHV26252.1 hypothetical protein FACS1894176_06620 [Bacteroidia bacterium]
MSDTPITPQVPVTAPTPQASVAQPIQASQPAPVQAPTEGANSISSDPIKYLEQLFDMMIKYDSSDIYLTYGEEPTLRVFGEARRIQGVPKLDDQTLDGIANYMMSEEDKKNYTTNLACDLGMSMHGRRYRVNISRQRDHFMIVVRLLEEKIPTIDEKGLPQIFKQLIQKTNGIIFVA